MKFGTVVLSMAIAMPVVAQQYQVPPPYGIHRPTYQASPRVAPSNPLLPAYGTGSNSQSLQVDGHFRRNGTFVEPHYRTLPNATANDNYGTSGNVNPYTGNTGTKHYQRRQRGCLAQHHNC